MRYLVLHYLDESIFWDSDGNEIADPAFDQAVSAWDDEMMARGVLVGGGAVRPVRDSTTLRVRSGEVLLTDGPYAETKEQMAGYMVLECATLDEAIEAAARHPSAAVGTFEVRPFLP
ncbi:MAG TPA: YciI family protein [Streptosporangiaceae bacterium]